MSVTKLLTAGALAFLIGGAAIAEDKVEYAKLIVGKWEVTKAAPGTVPPGSIIEFTKDGKVKVSAKKDTEEVTFEGTYKVEKDTFTMKLKVGDEEKTKTITITKISDKELSTKDEDDKVVEFKRNK